MNHVNGKTSDQQHLLCIHFVLWRQSFKGSVKGKRCCCSMVQVGKSLHDHDRGKLFVFEVKIVHS